MDSIAWGGGGEKNLKGGGETTFIKKRGEGDFLCSRGKSLCSGSAAGGRKVGNMEKKRE